MKFFNIAGPCDPERHYMIPAGTRCVNLHPLVDQGQYFVIHAPRQTGKTTLIMDFVDQLNEEGNYLALYCSLELAQGIDQIERGMRVILACFQEAVRDSHHADRKDFVVEPEPVAEIALLNTLKTYCASQEKPLVIMFDEVDCLTGDTLISFLRQLRLGYVQRRKTPFVHAMALVGMRNIRDYKAQLREGRETLGSASPFNVVSQALTIHNFSKNEMIELYAQYTQETGRTFSEPALGRIYEETSGQPWLCNAVAREITTNISTSESSEEINVDLVETAVENIILRRDTHIDSLLERLKEPRVRRILEPVILCEQVNLEFAGDDASYVFDLGLLVKNKGDVKPANAVYGEVIIRALTYESQYRLPTALAGRFISKNRVDMRALLLEFQQFWRENSDIWVDKYDYKEAAPHLILQAFLQRIVNGGGRIDREYSAGRGRFDLCISMGEHRYALELKIRYRQAAREKGIEQLADYLDTLGLKEGWLILFDRDPNKPWEEKITWNTESRRGKAIHIVGC
ncbi:MAG: AAA-like domain-containing protein [Acidobacteriota bacterium]|nr:AAA-like domain-containing protein [Acidobacteriota bacterium]